MKLGIKRFINHFCIITGIVVAILFFSQWCLKQFTRHGQALEVPDFKGMTLLQATKIATEKSFILEVNDSLFLPNQKPGTILRQTPLEGSKVKKYRRILLSINSMLPQKVSAPSLVGFSLRQAKAEIASQNLRLGKLYYEDDFATNTVLEQMMQNVPLRPGTQINAHSVIDLILGVDPEHNIAYVPNLLGLNLDNAIDIVTDHYLNIGVVRFDSTVSSPSDSLAAVVVRQDPVASNTYVYKMGSAVNISLTLPQTTVSETKAK